MADQQVQPIIMRYSTVAGAVPPKSEFTLNTFCVNLADGLLYWLDTGGTVQSMPILPGNIVPNVQIASGTTTDIGALPARVVSITGTTAITSLGTGKNKIRSVVFGGALTLTHNAASLALPTKANILTAAGDTATFVSDSSGNWTCIQYQRADGSALQAAVQPVVGQCRFVYASATSIQLKAYKGNWITINGVPRQLTATISLPNTGLSASTRYYAYAYWTGTAVAAEWSTTGHATGTDGNEIKSGDATRTYLGMVFTDGSTPGQFQDSATYRYVAPWHNRYPRYFASNNGQNPGTASSNFVTLTGALNVYILLHADEIVDASIIGYVQTDTANSYPDTALSIDGTQAGFFTRSQAFAAGSNSPVSTRFATTVAEGQHTLSVLGRNGGGGSSTWALQVYGTITAGG